jgi:hypothetical protein
VKYPRVQPGERLSADLLNRLIDAIERLENMTADPSSGIELVRTPGGICLRLTQSLLQPDDSPVARVIGADTTLAAVVSDSQTSIAVAAAVGFPASGTYYVLVDSEILHVTGGAGTASWTVARGEFGTTPASHASDAPVYQATVLEAPCSAADTTIVVQDGSLFPQDAARTPYCVLVESEVMTVTSGAGTTALTVSRGQFDSAAADHPADAPVTLWVPSTPFAGVRQAVLTVQDPADGLTWTDDALVLLSPVNGPSDPYYIPLAPGERYFALPIEPPAPFPIPFYNAQAVAAPEADSKPKVAAVVRVTSTTTTDSLYPCDIESWADGDDVTPPAWSDGPAAGWVFPPNDETLTAARYPATRVGTHSDGRPVFTVTAPASNQAGSSSPIRVTSVSVDATSGMYPALVLNAADGTPVTFTDGDDCWAVGPNGGSLTAMSYIATLVCAHAADGKPVYAVAGTVVGGQCVSTPTPNVQLFTA